MADETAEIAEFSASLKPSDVAPATIERLALMVADNLVVGVIGARQPWYDLVTEMAAKLSRAGDSSLFGRTSRLRASHAALCNGVAIGAYEFEHVSGGSHPGATVFPAVWAVAQERTLEPELMLRGLFVGYEVGIRVAHGLGPDAERVRGFHRPAVAGVFGAAAGTAALAGLPSSRIAQAIGIAASHAAGIIAFVQNGSMIKRLHLGRSSQFGVESTLLAELGFTGPDRVLEGTYGFLAAFSPQPDARGVVADLGGRWMIDDLIVKQYNCHGESHSIVQAVRKLVSTVDLPIDSIERVIIRTALNGGEGRYHQITGHTALDVQYSLPLMAAISFVTDPRETDGFWRLLNQSQNLRALVDRITIVAQPDRFGVRGMDGGAEVEVHADGRVHVATTPARAKPEDVETVRTVIGDKLDACRRSHSASWPDSVYLDVAEGLLTRSMSLEGGLRRLLHP